MSPNESQLRAALHDGEGDRPDAGTVIAFAVRVRHERRNRINAIGGGVAVAAVIGVGATLLVHLGGTNSESATSSNGVAQFSTAAAGAAAGSSKQPAATEPHAALRTAINSAATSAASGSTVAAGCPATADRIMTPGANGSGQFGSTGALFPGNVVAMRVCAYPNLTSAKVHSLVINAPTAGALAATLEAAPSNPRRALSCRVDPVNGGATLEILAVNAQGTSLKPVVITFSCAPSEATNGTAVRYPNTVPKQLAALLP